jgi:hypothetical protein
MLDIVEAFNATFIEENYYNILVISDLSLCVHNVSYQV